MPKKSSEILIEEVVKANSVSKDNELEEFLEIEKQCIVPPSKKFIFEETKEEAPKTMKHVKMNKSLSKPKDIKISYETN